MCYTTSAAFHLSRTCVDCETKAFGSVLKIVLSQPHTWVIPGFSCWCLQCGGGVTLLLLLFFFYLVWWCSHCNIRGACPHIGRGRGLSYQENAGGRPTVPQTRTAEERAARSENTPPQRNMSAFSRTEGRVKHRSGAAAPHAATLL